MHAIVRTARFEDLPFAESASRDLSRQPLICLCIRRIWIPRIGLAPRRSACSSADAPAASSAPACRTALLRSRECGRQPPARNESQAQVGQSLTRCDADPAGADRHPRRRGYMRSCPVSRVRCRLLGRVAVGGVRSLALDVTRGGEEDMAALEVSQPAAQTAKRARRDRWRPPHWMPAARAQESVRRTSGSSTCCGGRREARGRTVCRCRASAVGPWLLGEV
jgi:hypothetical protein